MLILTVAFIVTTLFSAFCLWCGLRYTKVEGNFTGMLVIAAISALLGLLPMIGWLLALVAMFFLICKWTTAQLWPDAVLMVVVANAFSTAVKVGLWALLTHA